MTVPSNAVFIDGGPAVSGDNLNTLVQTANTMSDLRSFIGVSGMQVTALGQNSVNDGQGGTFFWNDLGTAADDNGVTTVQPSGAAAGEWTRLTLPSVGGASGGLGGVWTPTLYGGTTVGSPSYALQAGFYRQVGGVVTAFFNVTIASIGGIAGIVGIGGLPLTSNTNTQNSGGAMVTDYTGLLLNVGCFSVSGIIVSASNSILLDQHGLNASPNLTEANLTATAHFRGVAIYQSP